MPEVYAGQADVGVPFRQGLVGLSVKGYIGAVLAGHAPCLEMLSWSVEMTFAVAALATPSKAEQWGPSCSCTTCWVSAEETMSEAGTVPEPLSSEADYFGFGSCHLGVVLAALVLVLCCILQLCLLTTSLPYQKRPVAHSLSEVSIVMCKLLQSRFSLASCGWLWDDFVDSAPRSPAPFPRIAFLAPAVNTCRLLIPKLLDLRPGLLCSNLLHILPKGHLWR